MTALDLTTDLAPRPLGRRLWNVARLHAANPFTILVTPLIVLGIIFLANLVIWWVIFIATTGDTEAVGNVSTGLQWSGASMWTFVYMMVVAIQAMNLTFPFALGFGSTRRDFSLGTALTFIALSAFYALIYTGMAALETATQGWGLNGAMFTAIYFGDVPSGVRLFHVFTAFLFFFSIGTVFGAIYVRYRARGLILFFLVLTLVLIGLVALATLTANWVAVGEFFATLGLTGTYALSLVVSAVAALAGYLVLQRATPQA